MRRICFFPHAKKKEKKKKKRGYEGMNDIPYTAIAGEVHKRTTGIHGVIKRITSVLLI
jgi:hypothetical protein